MSYLNSEKPPSKYDPGYFKMFVERVRTAINYISESNFPDGIMGSWLRDKSVSMTKLVGGLFEINLVSLASPYTTASTTLVNVSGLSHWEAGALPSTARCYLEVTGTSSNVAATATFELYGATGLITSVSTSKGDFEWLRSAAFTPLTQSQTLVLKAKTSSASYLAGVLNAKIVIIL